MLPIKPPRPPAVAVVAKTVSSAIAFEQLLQYACDIWDSLEAVLLEDEAIHFFHSIIEGVGWDDPLADFAQEISAGLFVEGADIAEVARESKAR